MQGETYRSAGVDIEKGYEAKRRIKSLARATFRPEVLSDVGAFGAFFAFDGQRYREPILVSGADNVGTKLKIASRVGRHDTVGIDAVAYCVNDLLCHGAEPLFFLDYIAIGRMDPDLVEAIVAGVAAGCREAGCSLIGGETAEVPGQLPPGEYDLAGFAVGVVERARLIDGQRVRPGDRVVGLASTGLQSNGFSLVRRVVIERAQLDLHRVYPELGEELAQALLRPTRIYAGPIRALIDAVEVHGIANITGGGLIENLPRAMAAGTRAVVRRGAWPIPPIFRFVQRHGAIDEDEMWRTFNMGVGMAVIVPAEDV
ncbi:MAG TPA: phosphoribosylformylglycinamidine cyclo-ligase, partial [Limnochordia bacterium]